MVVPQEHQTTLVDILQYRAEHQRDEMLFTFLADGEGEGLVQTYAEIDSIAKTIAAQLQQHTQPGDRALLLFQSGPDFIHAFLACLYAGVVAVPAYPPRKNHNVNRLEAIIQDCQPNIVLATEAVASTAKPMFDVLDGHQNLHWICSDAIQTTAQHEYQDHPCKADDIAFLQYTSGSTGTPKGVMVSHGNLIYNEKMIESAWNTPSDIIYVSWLPLFHDMGLIGGALQPIFLGGSAVIMPPAAFLQKPSRWIQAISDTAKQYQRPIASGGPNFGFQLACDQIKLEQLNDIDLSLWRYAQCGAEPIREATIQAFGEKFSQCQFDPNVFYPCYGMAETTLIVSSAVDRAPLCLKVDARALEENRVEQANNTADETATLIGCGFDLLQGKTLIVEPSSLSVLADKTIGEIWTKGPHIAKGYWAREAQTKETFQAYTEDGQGPFLRTGDLGCKINGEIFITGRLKDLIIVRGRNHYPTDIEQTVETCHDAIRTDSSAAFTVEIGGEEQLVVVAEVERSYRLKLDVEATAQSLRTAITKEHEIPLYSIVFLRPGAILKTSSGKIQRSQCKAAYLSETLNSIGEWRSSGFIVDKSSVAAPELTGKFCDYDLNSLSAWVCSWIAHRKGIAADTLDMEHNFAALGLDSVDSIQLMAALENGADAPLKTEDMWELESIRELCTYLLALESDDDSEDSDDNIDLEGFL